MSSGPRPRVGEIVVYNDYDTPFGGSQAVIVEDVDETGNYKLLDLDTLLWYWWPKTAVEREFSRTDGKRLGKRHIIFLLAFAEWAGE